MKQGWQTIWHDGSGEPWPGNGRNTVAQDIVLFSLQSQGAGQTHHPRLGGRIVGLPEVTVDTGRRRDRYYPARITWRW